MLYRKAPAQAPRLLLKIAAIGASSVAVACSGATSTQPSCEGVCAVYPAAGTDAPNDGSPLTCGNGETVCGLYPVDAEVDASREAGGPCGGHVCGTIAMLDSGPDGIAAFEGGPEGVVDAGIVGELDTGIEGIGPAPGH